MRALSGVCDEKSEKNWIAAVFLAGFVALADNSHAQDKRPIIDAHIHYSHDAWEIFPPAKAVELLRQAGLKKAFVSARTMMEH